MTTKEKAEYTVACSIGKHRLCSGEGNRGPKKNGESFKCACLCHHESYRDNG